MLTRLFINGAGMECQWDHVDMHEGRCAGPSLHYIVVCADDEDRSWLHIEELKYQKELHS